MHENGSGWANLPHELLKFLFVANVVVALVFALRDLAATARRRARRAFSKQ